MKAALKSFISSYNFFKGIVGNGMLLLILTSFIAGLFDSIGITLVFPLVKMLMGGTYQEVTKDIPFSSVIAGILGFFNLTAGVLTYSLFVVSIFLFKSCIKFFEAYYRITLSSSLIKNLRYDLMKQFSKLDYIEYSRQNIGNVTNVATVESQRTISAFLYYSEGLLNLFTGLAYIFFVLYYDVVTSGLCVVLGVLYFVIFVVPTKNIRKLSSRITSRNSEFSGILIQFIQSFKYLKATRRFDPLLRKAHGVLEEVRVFQRRQGFFQGLIKSFQEPLMIIFILGVFFFQSKVMHMKSDALLPVLLLFYRSLTYFINFQSNITSFYANEGGLVSMKGFFKTMKENEEVIHPSNINSKFNKEIKFVGLKFSYNKEKTVINGIDLTIPKNSTIAFVGPSGSGKSTSVDLICGLLPNYQGSILVDGVELNTINNHDWQDSIGYITQENVVFNDNVVNNITLWSEPDIENLDNALKDANASSFVKKLSKGKETNLGDRGMLISGGQRQRIAIARELYGAPQLLVLDEATSALDAESELAIQETIDTLKGKMTMVIVAHRLSSIRTVDKIFVMDNGLIVEEGTFEELMAKKSLFHSLAVSQGL